MRTNSQLDKHRKRNNKVIKKISSSASRSRKKSKNHYGIIILVLLAVFAAAFFLNDRFLKIDGIPTWDDLYRSAGLSSTTQVEGEVSVHFIDVGQGDCELIRTKSKNILIDCGEKEYYSTVIDYIKSQNISRLDYIVVTHPHSDHAGGMSYIINEFEVGKVIMPKLQDSLIPTTSTYTRLLTAIDDNGVEVEYAQSGKKYDLDDCEMTILAPVTDYDDLNNYSVTLKFIHGNNSFLLTGDIEEEAEKDILNSGADVSADVLKVAHHGSSTSSKKSFLKAVAPDYAVIEVGSPNSYNHPNSATLERLENLGAEIYRTDLNGNIVFVSDGQSLSVTTEKES